MQSFLFFVAVDDDGVWTKRKLQIRMDFITHLKSENFRRVWLLKGTITRRLQFNETSALTSSPQTLLDSTWLVLPLSDRLLGLHVLLLSLLNDEGEEGEEK